MGRKDWRGSLLSLKKARENKQSYPMPSVEKRLRRNMGMNSFLRVMEYEVHREEKKINNNEGVGQQSPLVSPVLKNDGKSIKDDRNRNPLVCCHMHLLSLKNRSRQLKQVFLYLFFFFFLVIWLGKIIQVNGGQNAYEVSLSCAEMILLPWEFLVAL